ncbi:hypothetical protein OCAE111667_04040 [Occultella aeris]|uniref:Uncharacterized protein n=1 Tax=Occultella aeris TaxID=2761496 RepID=A0A7M4DGA6_9MICO|nr:hypothetical protein HALOF300_01152 [Occultella aeris]
MRVSKWKSIVSLVLLEGDSGDDESTARVIEEFPVTGDDTEWAAHVGNVATAVRGHAKSMKPDVVIVRRADQAPQGRNSDGPKLRLMIEGGIVTACLDVTSDVRVYTGKECGKARDVSKDDLDTRSATLVAKAHLEAGAAALAAMA